MHCLNTDKWTCIEQRDKELLRARKSQAAHEAERMVGPDGRRTEVAIPMAEPRGPSETEREVPTPPLLPQAMVR